MRFGEGVQPSGEGDVLADVAELRQSQTVFVIEADAALLIPRAVALLMPPFRLEARVSRDFLEELLKSCVKIPQSSLQCHGICFFQPRSILATFQIRQELASFSKTDRTVVGIVPSSLQVHFFRGGKFHWLHPCLLWC